jgi:hypothetical protein
MQGEVVVVLGTVVLKELEDQEVVEQELEEEIHPLLQEQSILVVEVVEEVDQLLQILLVQ